MQKKSSYRFLKWTLLACATASLASACVVTTGDGSGDFFDGGEGGTNNTAGTKANGGDTTQAGTSGSAGTTTTAGTGGASAGAGGTSAGAGGGEEPVPGVDSGLCQGTDNPSPSMLPSCDPDAKDEGNDCRKCQRANCCDAWRTCYGSEPLTACGWGADLEANGQFDCIAECYDKKIQSSGDDEATIKEDCESMCLNQCDDDGLITDATNDLMICTTDKCNDECFPPPM